MRSLVITDIHANLNALRAVLDDAGEVDAVWCLGDVVGYGPNPNECLNLMRSLPNLVCLLGNHDAASAGMLDIETFNPEARLSVAWTQSVLTPENRDYLKERPLVHYLENVTLVHGSPRHPIYEYLLDTRSATDSFEHFDTDYCIVGHTHLPVMFTMRTGEYMARFTVPSVDEDTTLQPRAILNPGSVGQPRDRDPRAAYAIYDSEAGTWRPKRIAYNVAGTQEQMEKFKLPQRHISRLSSGW